MKNRKRYESAQSELFIMFYLICNEIIVMNILI